MCRYRVGRLLRTVAARLNKHTGQVGAFHAWNKCLNHLLELANAHIEATMLDAFYNGVNACVDPDARKALKVPHYVGPLSTFFNVCSMRCDSIEMAE